MEIGRVGLNDTSNAVIVHTCTTKGTTEYIFSDTVIGKETLKNLIKLVKGRELEFDPISINSLRISNCEFHRHDIHFLFRLMIQNLTVSRDDELCVKEIP